MTEAYRLAKKEFLARHSTWSYIKWDYTEWEEFDEACKSFFGGPVPSLPLEEWANEKNL